MKVFYVFHLSQCNAKLDEAASDDWRLRFEKYPLRFVFNNIDFSHFNPMIVFLNFPIVTVTTHLYPYITIGLCSMEKSLNEERSTS